MRLEHVPEPPLEFGGTLSYEVFDPIYGLARLGPFDFTRERCFDSLSVAAIGPQIHQKAFSALWKNLLKGVERLGYQPKYEDGFAGTYRLEEVALSKTQDLDGYVSVDQFTGETEEAYRSAIQYVSENQRFDVLFIVEPERPVEHFHNILKRDCIARNIPTQYLEADTLRQCNYGSVLHNIAVATYAKAGGVPWRVKHPTLDNCCILGLSFHLARAADRSQRTIVGVAEILDEFGRHITMKASYVTVAFDTVKEFKQEFNSLYVPRNLMEPLVMDVLRPTLWPNRACPTRLVLHKTTAFHEEEITGLQAALEQSEVNMEYALVHVKEKTTQRVYRLNDRRAVRGLLLTLRDDIPEAYMWTVGKVQTRYWNKQKRDYSYDEKGGSKIGTANPIAIHLDPASRCPGYDVTAASRQVFAIVLVQRELEFRLG